MVSEENPGSYPFDYLIVQFSSEIFQPFNRHTNTISAKEWKYLHLELR